MRKVLLVSYYFPPAGGQGVQRALRFAQYLPAYGWQPSVLTVRPEDASYPHHDATLAADVPPDVAVERTASWDPYTLYAWLQGKGKEEAVSVSFTGEGDPGWMQRVARWVRANVFLPDARVGWVPFAVRRGLQMLEREQFDAVLTTGPPHSTHLAGLLMQKRTGVRWVADFRDPWSEIDYAHRLPTTAPARTVDSSMERLVLQRADTVVTVTERWRDRLAAQTMQRPFVVRNGYDPASFKEAPPLNEAFSLVHVGNMNAARNPEVLWRALGEADARPWTEALRVRLVGDVDPLVLEAAREAGVGERVAVTPFRPHAEAVRMMQASPLLLLVVDDVPGQEGRVPGKLYEYLASGRPVLGIGPRDGEAAVLLWKSGAGRMFAADDAEGVRRFVAAHHKAWSRGQPFRGASAEQASQYSRKAQARALAELLDQTTADANT